MIGYDTFVVVDWSGGNDRGLKPKQDAIWAAVVRNGASLAPVYLRNRAEAETWLADLFTLEAAAGRRVLAGFDFPFGYPSGFGRALTGTDDPLALWGWFEQRVRDAPKANNRFDLAAEVNRRLGYAGPFWANGLKRDIDGLTCKKPLHDAPFAERRLAEQGAKGSFTCWQLAGAGAVGSQIIMGLPVLERLRRRFPIAVWPFQPLDQPITLIEVWPSLTVMGPPPAGVVKDSWQVAQLANQLAAIPNDRLARMLDVRAPEEGWIFGLGFEKELQGAGPPPMRNDCFALPPGVHWTPVAEALDLLRSRLRAVTKTQVLPLDQVAGRIAACDISARRSNPPLPNTAVDGYGFAGGRCQGPHRLPLAQGRAAAGDLPGQLAEGHAMRVLTGAALPQGVDTVILQEDVRVEGDSIVFSGPIKMGANTRRAGEDVSAGQTILKAGQHIGPAELALLAATGVAELSVRSRLRVGILSTGDELVDVGNAGATRDGQIFDANRPMLMALIQRLGHKAVDLGRAPDDRNALRQMLDDAANRVDAILTSGGASAGDEDHVSALLSKEGAMTVWRIAIKPGRPLALGIWDGVPVFGLPGNPVAAMVCTLIFARPALNLLAGAEWTEPVGFDVPAAFSKRKKAGRREYLRARIRDGRAEAFSSEGSGRISGLAWAEGLVELPEPACDLSPGDKVRFIPYGSFTV